MLPGSWRSRSGVSAREGRAKRQSVTSSESCSVDTLAPQGDYDPRRRPLCCCYLAPNTSGNCLKIPAASLEGYLFPDTYFFPPGYPAEAILEQMALNFFDRLGELDPEARKLSPRELHDKLILASIVEREYRLAKEAPLIASVFVNRLRYNIGLESCATLEYIITDLEDRPHPRYLTEEDKRINSPYNTYKWAGLPPGPISNPGRVALAAALHPAKTGFYYFVVKDAETGQHYFSDSLKQHNWAKYLYLKQVGAGG